MINHNLIHRIHVACLPTFGWFFMVFMQVNLQLSHGSDFWCVFGPDVT